MEAKGAAPVIPETSYNGAGVRCGAEVRKQRAGLRWCGKARESGFRRLGEASSRLQRSKTGFTDKGIGGYAKHAGIEKPPLHVKEISNTRA